MLRPGGNLIILETSVPKNFTIKQCYFFYTHIIIKILISIFSGDKLAYNYLSYSAVNFPYGVAFNNILKKNGFIEVEDLPQTFGVVSIYCAKKPL